MKEERYIAALEIGSFKITGAVGLYSPESHTLRVLAVDQEESRDSVRYGIIQNPDELAARVSRIMGRLENNPAVAPRLIEGVFVGLSGRSMHSVSSDVSLTFPDDTEFTAEMLADLREDATAIELDGNMEILATVPRSYIVDGMETTSPKGAMGKSISAVFDVIVGRSEIKRNILRSVTEKAGLAIKGFIVTALAAADVVLSEEEKRLGCMLVDFGAETTAVSIYQKGALRYYATIPLGGRNITRDLTTLSILEEKAEEIKIESGRAVASETPSALNINGIKLTDVSNLVVARAEEIVANVIQQIFYAGLKEKDLPAGIVCIGAGANLNGIVDLISSQSGLNARRGNLSHNIVAVDTKAKRHDTIETAAILFDGALTGVADCLVLPSKPEPEPEPDPDTDGKDDGGDEPDEGKIGKFFRGISSKLSNIFAPPSDDESELE